MHEVYAIPADNMGVGWTETDMQELEQFIRDELIERDLDGDYTVHVVERMNGYSFVPDWQEELKEAIDAGWEKWLASHQ